MISSSYPPSAIAWGNPVNWQCPINFGLVSWWLCGSPCRGATWYDLCKRNHGTLTSMDPPNDWISARGRPGGFGALDFDGVNDHVVLPRITACEPPGPATITAFVWVQTAVASGTFVRVGNINTDQAYLLLTAASGTAYSFAAWGNSYNASGGTVTTGRWTHLAGTTNSTVAGTNLATFSLYVDGELAATDSTGTVAAPVAAVASTIGAATVTPSFLCNAKLDDVRLFNRCLSASEISALYTDSRQGCQRTLNRVRRSYGVQAGGAPPPDAIDPMGSLGFFGVAA